MRGGAWPGVVVAAVAVAACGTSGVVHRVQSGETLYWIGKAYGVSHQDLARANDIDDPDRIAVGQVLRIPRARPAFTGVGPGAVGGPGRADAPTAGAFGWPIDGAMLASTFGPRGRGHHDGIDLSAPPGTPVRAARAGRVVYADRLRGYGKVVIVAHGDGWVTLYAHNRENHARAGDEVQRGAVIAALGASGTTTGPNLHFEIRKDDVAYDPLHYLPAAAGVRGVLTRRAGDPDS